MVDILLVAFLIYRLLVLVRGTRAWRIVGGVLVFMLFLAASSVFGLDAFHWLMDKGTVLAPVALVILLLPELRQALEQFGEIGFWPKAVSSRQVYSGATTVNEVVMACETLASSRTGAIIVVERTNPLDEIISNGVPLHSHVTGTLLESIFYGQNPLHDGAVVIRNDTIEAAACRLPLSERSGFDPLMHMRHRAAAGVSEQFDCVAIVVSEERGTISISIDGQLQRVQASELRDALNRELRGITGEPTPKIRRLAFVRQKEKEKESNARVS